MYLLLLVASPALWAAPPPMHLRQCAVIGPSHLGGFQPPFAQAARSRTPSMAMSPEDAAKRAWLAKLDAPTWGPKVAPLRRAPRYYNAAPVEAPPTISEEQAILQAQAALSSASSPDQRLQVVRAEEMRVWMANRGERSAATRAARRHALKEVCASGDDVACKTLSFEEQAMANWMSARTHTESRDASERATRRAQLAADCHQGNNRACETLSHEEDAKAAWLAKVDAPAAFVPADEASAKAAWLAKLEAPAWGQGMVTPTAGSEREEAAKKAWLAKLQ